MSPLPSVPTWIETDRQLRECCERLSQCAAVAVDTEFMRSNTFYPKAALFQLASENEIYLVDPLGIKDFAPFVALLRAPAVTKVIHSCSEDLEVFASFLDTLPEPLVDTQIAAALLNYGPSVGYGALVQQTQQLELPKGATRSDWLQRPLSETQKLYAAQDVAYLLPIYAQLKQALTAKQRWQWLEDDCRQLLAVAKQPADHGEFYRRIKSAWKLNQRQLAVLQALSDWREQKARAENVPRNHLVHEKVLWEIASQLPRSTSHLQSIGGLSPRKLRGYGPDLLALVEREIERDPATYPEKLPPPLPANQRELMSALRERTQQVAAASGLPAEILARKADFEFIVRAGMPNGDFRLPPRLQGWRKHVIGEELIAIATSFQSR